MGMDKRDYYDESATQEIADRLSSSQRRFLLQHIDGPVPFVAKARGDLMVWTSLRRLTLLRAATFPYDAHQPRRTALTERGRGVVALILAGYAEALIAAGCLDPDYRSETPLQILQRLKASRSQTNPAKSPNLKNSTKPSSSDSDIGR